MRKVIVFLGPSLDWESARQLLDAEYRAPAARGDITRAALEGASVIGLIDGVFFQECSVAHREILAVLRQGVRVVGASSMGALRAAELDTLGMEGVGEVYRMYRDGELVADDEVALIFDPESYIALSEPLVNIRATLSRGLQEGVITSETQDVLLAAAQRLYFPDRTYGRIVREAEDSADADELSHFSSWVEEESVDQKRMDAILALERIGEILTEE